MYNYYVYILKCSDNTSYTRITNNINRRVKEHQEGNNKKTYASKRRPVVLEYFRKFNNVLEAIYFEKKLKGWTRAKKVALIKGDYHMLQILAECRNASNFKYNN